MGIGAGGAALVAAGDSRRPRAGLEPAAARETRISVSRTPSYERHRPGVDQGRQLYVPGGLVCVEFAVRLRTWHTARMRTAPCRPDTEVLSEGRVGERAPRSLRRQIAVFMATLMKGRSSMSDQLRVKDGRQDRSPFAVRLVK